LPARRPAARPRATTRRRPSLAIARAAAIALACAALVAGFVLWRLPYARAAAPLSAALSRATSLEISIGGLAPRLSWLGPGLVATQLRVATPGGVALPVERLQLRPAWSPQWLLLRPRWWIDAELAGGGAAGRLGLAPGASFAGHLAGIDLEALPLAALWPGAAFTGHLDARFDLRAEAGALAGSIELDARDGSAALPTLSLPLPFATLTARLELGVDPRLRLVSLELVGPVLRARGSGTLGASARLAAAPLDLAFELEADPDLRPALAGLGLRLDQDGRARLRISGTLDGPVVH
jgi:type II secretion system protein N